VNQTVVPVAAFSGSAGFWSNRAAVPLKTCVVFACVLALDQKAARMLDLLGLLGLAVSVLVLATLILYILPDEEELRLLRALLLVLAVSVGMSVILAVLTPLTGRKAAALVGLPCVAALLLFLLVQFCSASIRRAALITGLFFAYLFLCTFLWLIIEAASR
jgi:hypothetical protein